MRIGTTKELKNHEYRVGLTPDNVMAYVNNGHEVYVEKGAGAGAGFAMKNTRRRARLFYKLRRRFLIAVI